MTRSTPAVRISDVTAVGTRQREDRGRRRGQQEKPEQQLAEERHALVHRDPAALQERARISPPAPHLPEPEQEQHAGNGEQRQESGRAEIHRARSPRLAQSPAQAVHPFRTLVVPLPAFSASSRSSGRIGTIILNFFMSDASGGAPATP